MLKINVMFAQVVENLSLQGKALYPPALNPPSVDMAKKVVSLKIVLQERFKMKKAKRLVNFALQEGLVY